jgi:hypothetical protein
MAVPSSGRGPAAVLVVRRPFVLAVMMAEISIPLSLALLLPVATVGWLSSA